MATIILSIVVVSVVLVFLAMGGGSFIWWQVKKLFRRG